MEFELSVSSEDLIKGEIYDIYDQEFNWHLLDAVEAEHFRKGESYNATARGVDGASYSVNIKIPSDGPWFLVVDLQGREKERSVILDLEIA